MIDLIHSKCSDENPLIQMQMHCDAIWHMKTCSVYVVSQNCVVWHGLERQGKAGLLAWYGWVECDLI